MRTVTLQVVHPEAVVTPWYKTRRALMTGKVLWWLLTFLWGLAKAMVIVLALIVGVLLMAIGIMTHFVGGPSR